MSTESYIYHGAKGQTLFVGPDATQFVAAVSLASALRLYARARIKVNRAYTPTAMLRAAERYTGKHYKRGHYYEAAEDVTKWADEMRAALPHITAKGGQK